MQWAQPVQSAHPYSVVHIFGTSPFSPQSELRLGLRCIFGSIPHGASEITAKIVALSSGCFLQKNVSKKLISVKSIYFYIRVPMYHRAPCLESSHTLSPPPWKILAVPMYAVSIQHWVTNSNWASSVCNRSSISYDIRITSCQERRVSDVGHSKMTRHTLRHSAQVNVDLVNDTRRCTLSPRS